MRVGGRSSCEALADKNLRELSKAWREMDERAAEGVCWGPSTSEATGVVWTS